MPVQETLPGLFDFKSRESGNAFPLQFVACEFRRQTGKYRHSGTLPGLSREGGGRPGNHDHGPMPGKPPACRPGVAEEVAEEVAQAIHRPGKPCCRGGRPGKPPRTDAGQTPGLSSGQTTTANRQGRSVAGEVVRANHRTTTDRRKGPFAPRKRKRAGGPRPGPRGRRAHAPRRGRVHAGRSRVGASRLDRDQRP